MSGPNDRHARVPTALSADDLLRHSAWVTALARRLVRDSGVADDLVQETWLAALRAGRAQDEELRPWLGRVVTNFARQRRRSERARAARERETARDEAIPSHDEHATRLETQRELVNALLALDAPLRETLVLRYLDGLTSVEAARKLGVPEGTVRWRTLRGLELLRERLDRAHGGDRRAWCIAFLPLFQKESVVVGASGALAKVLVMKSVLAPVSLVALLLLLVLGGLRLSRWLGGGDSPARAVAEVASANALGTPRDERASDALAEERSRSALDAGSNSRSSSADSTTRLRLRVVASEGGPIAGAHVEIAGWSTPITAASNADGTVLVELPEWKRAPSTLAEVPIDVSITAVGRAGVARHLDLPLGLTQTLGTIVLARGGTLRGRVVDEDGRGLARVLVAADRKDTGSDGIGSTGLQAGRTNGAGTRSEALARIPSAACVRVRTDANGRYELRGLGAGMYSAYALAVGRSIAWTAAVPIEPDREIVLPDLELRANDPESCVSGRILDADGEPAAFAFVKQIDLDPDDGQEFHETRADEHGHFWIEWTSRDVTFDLLVASARENGVETLVHAVPRNTHGLTLTLSSERRLSLAVRDRLGEPVSEFCVFVSAASVPAPFGRIGVHEQATHPNGEFEIPLPARRFQLYVDGPRIRGWSSGELDPLDVGGRLEITVDRPALVRGRVLHDGLPVANALVERADAFPRAPRQMCGWRTSGGPLSTRVDRQNLLSTVSDAQGRFAIRFGDADTVAVRASAPGCAAAILWDVRPDSPELELALGRGGAIEGVVRVAEGESHAGRWIVATCGDGVVFSRRSDEDGRFRFEHLTPGPWQVRVADERSERNIEPFAHTDAPAATDAVVEQDRTARVEIDATAIARVRGIVSVDGAPSVQCRVRVSNETSSRLDDVCSDALGAYCVVAPDAGRYTLSFSPRLGPDVFTDVEWPLDLERRERTLDLALALGEIEAAGELLPFVSATERGRFRFEGLSAAGVRTNVVLSLEPGVRKAIPVGDYEAFHSIFGREEKPTGLRVSVVRGTDPVFSKVR